MKKLFYFSMIALFITACGETGKKPAEEAKEIESEDWISMFDGETPGKWRGYNKDYFPSGWEITDGTLRCIASGQRRSRLPRRR